MGGKRKECRYSQHNKTKLFKAHVFNHSVSTKNANTVATVHSSLPYPPLSPADWFTHFSKFRCSLCCHSILSRHPLTFTRLFLLRGRNGKGDSTVDGRRNT